MEHQPASPRDMAATNGPERRINELRAMLEARRDELLQDVHSRIRGARIDNHDRHAIDQGEGAENDIQEEIEFALIQMSAETLKKIELALRRLDEGTYGNCAECASQISEARLRALPFAVRCKDCEEARETADQRERNALLRRHSSSSFFDAHADAGQTVQ